MKKPIWILVVDDHQSVRELIRNALDRENYTVRVAANGLEALDALASNAKIACIVTDVVMPKMDGITVAMKLHDARPTLPIVIISGRIGLEAASIQALAILMNSSTSCSLQKPFSSAQLLVAVPQALVRACDEI
jgi:two-component system response regulator MprA